MSNKSNSDGEWGQGSPGKVERDRASSLRDIYNNDNRPSNAQCGTVQGPQRRPQW